MINRKESRTVTFTLGDMIFEYDEQKNEYNIEHHGISFKQAARVFFDYDRIELYDEENSEVEDRYDTIGDLSVGYANAFSGETVIGNIVLSCKLDAPVLCRLDAPDFDVARWGSADCLHQHQQVI